MVQIVLMDAVDRAILIGKLSKEYCSAFLHICICLRCYNGGRCTAAYGQPYCVCGQNYRGRRCELRYNAQNYVYLHRHPSPYW